ncbi:cullin family protein [Striga asiatica]|uniref:Cullin family protein n=1 Tax=Striga asiatica TaxID=4170 RepID=A0A5A7R7H4_STRAF|nr:cullin family protein [Striga asiatica]
MDGGASVKNLLTFDEAWPILQREGIDKIIHSIETEGQPIRQCFTSEEYMRLYTPEVDKMYNQYRKTFEDYISSKVLPALRGKVNVDLLKELQRRWKDHKIMKMWLTRFFNFIERYYIPFRKLPSLEEISNSAFYSLVFCEMKDQVNDAIISMPKKAYYKLQPQGKPQGINKEREGERIDRVLMKEVLDIYAEISEGSSRNYGEDIEKAIIEATSKFYSRSTLNWTAIMSKEEYTRKDVKFHLAPVTSKIVAQCLQQEKERVSDYMNGLKSKNKVFEAAQNELLDSRASNLRKEK